MSELIIFFLFLCWTQKTTFERMLLTKQLLVAIDFHSIFPRYYGRQWLMVTHFADWSMYV